MIYQILFSATGRSKKVMDIISSCWDEEKTPIDISAPDFNPENYKITDSDLCIFTTSVYAGRVPAPAVENIRKISGNGARAILIAVFGNRTMDDCLLEMKDITTAQGFVPVAAVEASVQHSILTMVEADRPDNEDTEQLKDFAQQIKALLEKNIMGELQVPGKRPYLKMSGIAFKPTGNDSCTGCGLCAEKCPVQAIPYDNPKGVDADKCITCMRCVELCPVGARNLPAPMVDKVYNMLKHEFVERKPNKLYLMGEN